MDKVEPPVIYDITIDECRPVTQEDVENFEQIRRKYAALLSSIKSEDAKRFEAISNKYYRLLASLRSLVDSYG